MSELKEIGIRWEENGELHFSYVYLKSEADKVIAEKDAEIAELKADYKEACGRLQTANLIKDEQLAATRHSNYKRCLAMAKWCHNQREIYERDSYDWELDADSVTTLRNKANIMRKWRKRWLELAEKFKEAK